MKVPQDEILNGDIVGKVANCAQRVQNTYIGLSEETKPYLELLKAERQSILDQKMGSNAPSSVIQKILAEKQHNIDQIEIRDLTLLTLKEKFTEKVEILAEETIAIMTNPNQVQDQEEIREKMISALEDEIKLGKQMLENAELELEKCLALRQSDQKLLEQEKIRADKAEIEV